MKQRPTTESILRQRGLRALSAQRCEHCVDRADPAAQFNAQRANGLANAQLHARRERGGGKAVQGGGTKQGEWSGATVGVCWGEVVPAEAARDCSGAERSRQHRAEWQWVGAHWGEGASVEVARE